MTFASLGFAIDTTPLKRAVDEMKKLPPATAEAERAAGRLVTNGSRVFQQFEREVIRSNSRITGSIGSVTASFGSMVKTFGAGVLGGLAAGGLIGFAANLHRVAENIARIGDEAKKARLSNSTFQQWTYAAEQLRIPVQDISTAFRELNERASEFSVTGKGAGAEAFRGLGIGAEDLKSKLEQPSDLLLEIIERLGQFDRASQIRLADKIFGGNGERFVKLIDQGAEGVREIMREAETLGLVIDDSLIRRADEVDRKFGQIANTVGFRLKSAIVSAADSLAKFFDGWRDFENQQTQTLDSQLARIGKQRLDIENQILRLRGGETPNDGIFGTSIGRSTTLEAIADLERQNEALAAAEARILDVLRNRPTVPTMDRSGNRTWTPEDRGGGRASTRERNAYRDLIKAAQDRIDQLALEADMVGRTGVAADTYRFKLELLQKATNKGRELDERKIKDIERLTEAYGAAAAKVAALTAAEDLIFERQQMFRSPTEQRVHATLRDYGLDVDTAQGQAIANQIRLNEQLAIGRDLTYNFASGFVSDLMRGVDAMDALASAAGRLGDRLLDMALNEAINSLFNNLLGGGGGNFLGGLLSLNLRSEA